MSNRTARPSTGACWCCDPANALNRPGVGRAPPGLPPWAGLASLGLHGAALAAVLLLMQRAPRPEAGAGETVAVVWQEQRGEDAGEPQPPAAPVLAEAPPPPPEAIPPPSALTAMLPPVEGPAAASLPPPPPDIRPDLPEAPAEPSPPPLPPRPIPQAQPPSPPPPRPRPAPQRQASQAARPTVAPTGPPTAPPAGPASPQPPAEGGSPVLGAVTPPGLADGIRNPEPEYPAASQARGEQGVVTVVLRVSAAGGVDAVEVVRSSGHPALDESAMRAVRRWRFRPASRDGLAIPGSIRTAIHFRLRQ